VGTWKRTTYSGPGGQGLSPQKETETLGPVFQIYPFKKNIQPHDNVLVPAESACAKYGVCGTFFGRVMGVIIFHHRRVTSSRFLLFKRLFRGDSWGLQRPGGHIRDRADQGYHLEKRAKLWDLGGGREPHSNAYSGTIPGARESSNTWLEPG